MNTTTKHFAHFCSPGKRLPLLRPSSPVPPLRTPGTPLPRRSPRITCPRLFLKQIQARIELLKSNERHVQLLDPLISPPHCDSKLRRHAFRVLPIYRPLLNIIKSIAHLDQILLELLQPWQLSLCIRVSLRRVPPDPEALSVMVVGVVAGGADADRPGSSTRQLALEFLNLGGDVCGWERGCHPREVLFERPNPGRIEGVAA